MNETTSKQNGKKPEANQPILLNLINTVFFFYYYFGTNPAAASNPIITQNSFPFRFETLDRANNSFTNSRAETFSVSALGLHSPWLGSSAITFIIIKL